MKETAKWPPMADVVFPRSSALKDEALVAGFAVFTAVCAQIALYFPPYFAVPITGQTLAVLLSGALLGARRGALSQLAYLSMGLAGLPVLAPRTPLGIGALLGPSGGYLVGFVVAAYVVGVLAERGWDRRRWTMAAAMLMGNGVIHLFGLPRLAFFLPPEAVWSAGFLPYVPGDALKLALAVGTVPSAWRVLAWFGFPGEKGLKGWN